MPPSNQDDFDGYRKWLGITSKQRPPTHYELLGIKLDEDDHEVIQAAVEQRRQYVESKRGLRHDAVVTEILYRISEAEATLLNDEMRRDYDRQQELFEKRRKNRQVDPNATRSRVKSRPGKTVGEDSGIIKTFAGIMAVVCVGFGVMAWFSFQMPWSKAAKQVEVAPAPIQQQQPVVMQVVQPPAAVQGLPPAQPVDVTTPPFVQNEHLTGSTIYKGHNYKVFREALDWKTAKSRCEAMGGHLVTISDEQENKFVIALATKTLGDINNSGIWLGATDESKEGQWEWVDGTPFTFSAWVKDQPNGKESENYLLLLLYFRGPAGNEFRGWCDQPNEGKIHVTYYACEWDSIESEKPKNPMDAPIGTWIEKRPDTPDGDRIRTFEKDGTHVTFMPKGQHRLVGTWRRDGSRVYFSHPAPNAQEEPTVDKWFEIARSDDQQMVIRMMGQREYVWTRSEVEPTKLIGGREKEIAHWKFWDALKGKAKKDFIIVSRDGVLFSPASEKGCCLTTLQLYSGLELRVEYQFQRGDNLGNPYIGVASTLPNPPPATEDWTKKIPYSVEVKLAPQNAGELVLPSSEYTAKLVEGQQRDGRHIKPLKPTDVKIGEWNTLEIKVDDDRKMVAKINGVLVNRLEDMQNIKGHIVIWLPYCEMRLRNAVVVSGGVETKLSFDILE